MGIAPVVDKESALGHRDEPVGAWHPHPKIDVGRLGQREELLFEGGGGDAAEEETLAGGRLEAKIPG